MHPVWEQKNTAMYVFIPPNQLLGQFETEIAMPPDHVWDYLIQPETLNKQRGGSMNTGRSTGYIFS
jgi:hypothetical protein